MKHRNIVAITTLFLTGTLSCLPALAAGKQTRLKAGLWQIDSQTALYGHVVPDVGAIIRLGPEKLQTHVSNMLRQNRMRIDENGIATVCVTKQQIASNRFVNDQGSGCSVSKGQRSGNNIRFDIVCEAPKGSGQTDVQIIDRTHWEATTRMTLTVRGISQSVDNKSYGTWLSTSCPAGL